ncbi:MAG: DNA repair protein RadC [Firmicutes bacterium]|jgi:DNA repair protein RadC|nr:DNA repair protein RadC [Bacillota bacterium]HPU01437.1 DNA repair protein RadC [Bacillota bacterium]
MTEEDRLLIRDLPAEERPREKLRALGAEALSNAELLAILLRSGISRESAVQLAAKLLSRSGGLRSLPDLTLEEMEQIKGVGPAKAIQVKAALELGRRLATLPPEEGESITSPRQAAALFMEQLRYEKREHFMILLLNTKNHVISKEEISIGSLNASIVHPREIFKIPLRKSAASIILVHNHPSGDPSPSQEDLEVTRRLVEAGNILGIAVRDHIVIGDGRYFSFKEKGLL